MVTDENQWSSAFLSVLVYAMTFQETIQKIIRGTSEIIDVKLLEEKLIESQKRKKPLKIKNWTLFNDQFSRFDKNKRVPEVRPSWQIAQQSLKPIARPMASITPSKNPKMLPTVTRKK